MKKFVIAAAVALCIFNFSETEAATVSVDNAEIVEMGPWTKFRDHLTGKREREKEEERQRQREREYYDRYDRVRGGYDDYDRGPRDRYDRGPRDGHYPPPPPPPPPRGRY